MVTDAQIVAHLHRIISGSDLGTTTAASVCRRLEADLCVDLSQRRTFVVAEVDKFVHGHDAVHEFVFEQQKADEEQQIGDEVVRNVRGGIDQGRSDGDGEEEASEKKRTMRKKSVTRTHLEAFHGLCKLSRALRRLFHVAYLSRTEVVEKIWAHIKLHNLQSPKDRRMIMCDNTLRLVFGVRKISIFEMSEELSSHIFPIDEARASTAKSSIKGKSTEN